RSSIMSTPKKMRSRVTTSLGFLSGICCLFIAQPGEAAQRTWNGGGGDQFWNNAGNWSSLPNTNGVDQLRFGGSTGTTNVNDFVGATLTDIVCVAGASAFTLTGNSITLNVPTPTNNAIGNSS